MIDWSSFIWKRAAYGGPPTAGLTRHGWSDYLGLPSNKGQKGEIGSCEQPTTRPLAARGGASPDPRLARALTG
eukprot:3137116-Prymnesium_polylepis.1